MSTPTLILASSSHSNSLGRALALALVAEECGPTTVCAPNTGPIWKPSDKFGIPVDVIEVRKLSRHIQNWIERNSRGVVWFSKGLSPTDKLAAEIRNTDPHRVIIFDRDDDDLALAQEYQASSLMNRVRVSLSPQVRPRRIIKAQESVSHAASGFTFASRSLESALEFKSGRSAIIPHARRPVGVRPKALLGSGHIRAGFLGTMRNHKGAAAIEHLLDQTTDIDLVVFENAGFESRFETFGDRVQYLNPRASFEEVYSRIDVALILSDRNARGADVQLPAKFADAVNAGVPIVATATSAITEFSRGILDLLPDGSSLEQLERAIRRSTKTASDLATRAIYDRDFSPAVLSTRYQALIEEIR